MKITIDIKNNNGCVVADIYLDAKFYTEIGCANLSELFKILSTHEICKLA